MTKLQIFEKQMNRREFLGHIGALMLAVMGISGIIKFFLQRSETPHQVNNGYSSQSYGSASSRSGLLG